MNKFYVYQHLNKENEIIYVGKTSCIKTRQNQHMNSSYWSSEIYKILYSELKNETYMAIYEIYYIKYLVFFLEIGMIEHILCNEIKKLRSKSCQCPSYRR
jgi:predicted GIY-YIG superfamily endonuclease